MGKGVFPVFNSIGNPYFIKLRFNIQKITWPKIEGFKIARPVSPGNG